MPTNAGQHPKSAAANASISIGAPKAEAFGAFDAKPAARLIFAMPIGDDNIFWSRDQCWDVHR
jgi:hypothetical protein